MLLAEMRHGVWACELRADVLAEDMWQLPGVPGHWYSLANFNYCSVPLSSGVTVATGDFSVSVVVDSSVGGGDPGAPLLAIELSMGAVAAAGSAESAAGRTGEVGAE